LAISKTAKMTASLLPTSSLCSSAPISVRPISGTAVAGKRSLIPLRFLPAPGVLQNIHPAAIDNATATKAYTVINKGINATDAPNTFSE